MSDSGKKKILIVDDDPALRQLYNVELSQKNYEVVEGEDGENGLIKAKTEKPDLILLDVMMPKFDGMAFLSKIKEDAEMAKIPIVMLTNFGQENLIQQAFTLGVTDYLLKYKVTPSEMTDKVNQVLNSSPVQF